MGKPIIKYSFTLLQPPWKASGDLFHQVLLGYALIDNVPQTLRARFGGEGQAGFLHLLGLFQGVLEHAVNAQEGKLTDTRFSRNSAINARINSGRQE